MVNKNPVHEGSHVCQTCGQKSASIFCNSKAEYLEEISSRIVSNTFKKGQTIFNEGSYPFGVFCINSGQVKLTHLGDDGKEQIIRLLKGGDIVGYRALLSEERYGATAVALEDSQICFIPKELFIHILKNDAAITFEMMKLLADELHKTEMKMTHLAQKPVRERLAEILLFIEDTYGFEEDGITLNVRLSREEIANLVGTATESTIRLLSEFKHDNMIELEGKKIKIIDQEKLKKVANLQDE
ncbi:transcriptional activator protein Anr [mine drainage metagenome]|uniref:Transcriptional activator protein Anr n=1 Tax=mine drainage metagenome TaxID=410659 RepID=A0A1J5RZL6_9ZZZZ